MLEIAIEEAIDMDNILQRLLKLKETHGSNAADVSFIYQTWLKEKGEYYTVELIYRMLSHEPKLLLTTKKQGIRTTVWPTPLAQNFLDIGGYKKIAKEQIEMINIKMESERLNIQKLRYDVKNSKRIFKTYWWTFAFSILALIISLILFVLKLIENQK